MRKTILTVPRCIGLAAVAGFAFLHLSSISPNDDVIISSFQNHRAVFEKLSNMVQEDKNIKYVTSKYFKTIGAIEPIALPSTDHFKEYASLLKQSGSSIVVQDGDPVERVCIVVWEWGAGALSSSLVRVCWMSDGNAPPAKYEKDVDASYRRIDSSWFIERITY